MKKEEIIEILRKLSNEERLEIFINFCIYCGSNDPDCNCWDDE